MSTVKHISISCGTCEEQFLNYKELIAHVKGHENEQLLHTSADMVSKHNLIIFCHWFFYILIRVFAKVEETEESFCLSTKVNSSSRWTQEQSFALINAYASFKEDFDGPKPKKDVWKRLAATLNFGFDSVQCQGRWKTMLKSRKEAEDNNRTSCRARKSYAFENELERVLGDKKNVHPAHLLESSEIPEITDDSETRSNKSRYTRSKLNGTRVRKMTIMTMIILR